MSIDAIKAQRASVQGYLAKLAAARARLAALDEEINRPDAIRDFTDEGRARKKREAIAAEAQAIAEPFDQLNAGFNALAVPDSAEKIKRDARFVEAKPELVHAGHLTLSERQQHSILLQLAELVESQTTADKRIEFAALPADTLADVIVDAHATGQLKVMRLAQEALSGKLGTLSREAAFKLRHTDEIPIQKHQSVALREYRDLQAEVTLAQAETRALTQGSPYADPVTRLTAARQLSTHHVGGGPHEGDTTPAERRDTLTASHAEGS